MQNAEKMHQKIRSFFYINEKNEIYNAVKVTTDNDALWFIDLGLFYYNFTLF